MAWEENSHICLHMQLIAILSRIEVTYCQIYKTTAAQLSTSCAAALCLTKKIFVINEDSHEPS